MRLAILVTTMVGLMATAHAGKKAGVTMPDKIQVGDKQLVLNGMGLRQATIFKVDVYVAGLYLETASKDAPAIITSAQSKRIVLQFVRDVDREKIVDAWTEGYEHNATVKFATIKSLVDKLNGWMPECKEGTVLTFTHEPGKGLAVDVDGKRKGVIENEDFARSTFAIWLGGDPPTEKLKKGLLNQ